jgi:hypothetical protein
MRRLLRSDKLPSAKHAKRVRKRTVEPLIDEARTRGAQVAISVDSDYGITRPAETVVVDRVGAAEVAGLLPGWREQSIGYERDMHRLGRELQTAQTEAWEAEQMRAAAAQAADIAAERLRDHEGHHLFTGPWAIAGGRALLLGMGVVDVALTTLVLYMLGMPTVITWVISAGFGVAQLLILHYVGGMFATVLARSRDDGTGRQLSRARLRGSIVVILAVAVPVLALAFLMGTLRADYLVLQNAALGGGPGVIGFPMAMATFCVMQLVLDSLAFLLGFLHGSADVKTAVAARSNAARQARQSRRARHRADQVAARFGAVSVTAVGHCEVCVATAWKAWAERRAASAGLYAGVTSAADPMTAATFSEAVQLEGLDEESSARVEATIAAIEQRRAGLVALTRQYGYAAAPGSGSGRTGYALRSSDPVVPLVAAHEVESALVPVAPAGSRRDDRPLVVGE